MCLYLFDISTVIVALHVGGGGTRNVEMMNTSFSLFDFAMLARSFLVWARCRRMLMGFRNFGSIQTIETKYCDHPSCTFFVRMAVERQQHNFVLVRQGMGHGWGPTAQPMSVGFQNQQVCPRDSICPTMVGAMVVGDRVVDFDLWQCGCDFCTTLRRQFGRAQLSGVRPVTVSDPRSE